MFNLENMMSFYYTDMASPFGPLRLLQQEGYLTAVFAETQPAFPQIDKTHYILHKPAFLETIEQLDAYFKQQLTRFTVPIQPEGTAFQKTVWHALNQVSYGTIQSYSALATAIHRPNACRAVANAVGKNPLLIIQPCHRIVGKDGNLTGFAAGLPLKQYLLNFEKNQLNFT
jgi:methylated-DNA-[protein]-cysteine S-methyltransferase